MYRVNIVNNKYRAVLVAAHASANTIIESDDWRVFAQKLKEAVEHEAAITLHDRALPGEKESESAARISERRKQ